MAQLFPRSIAERLPNLYEAIQITSGVLPWWAWTIGILLLALGGTVEFAVRQTRRLEVSEFTRLRDQQPDIQQKKRAYTIEELEKIRDIIHPRISNYSTEQTYFSFILDGAIYSYTGSQNCHAVISDFEVIGGASYGTMLLKFVKPFAGEYFAKIVSDVSIQWRVEEHTAESIKIGFHEVWGPAPITISFKT